MKKKTIIALAVLLACGQGVWGQTTSFPLHYDEKENPEDGTAAHPYQIQSVSDLNTLASDVNSGTDYSGKCFILTENLTFDKNVLTYDLDKDGTPDSNFTPIGITVLNDAGTDYDWDNSKPFKGTFDGNNKIIKGVVISGMSDLGVFGFIHGATIKKLTVDQSSIAGSTCLGGIVGQAYPANFVIENCHVTESVTIDGGDDGYLVGGIIGYGQTGTIKDCTSAATVKGNEAIGGIAGSFGDSAEQSTKSCIDCYYSASSVTGNESYGVIIGEDNDVDFAITLLDNDSEAAINNATRLSNYNGLKANLTLSGRTLYRDGSWNTLCLPFSLTFNNKNPLFDASDVRLLTSTSFGNGTLTLNFTTNNEIPAGTPFIAKWEDEGQGNITNPEFDYVTIPENVAAGSSTPDNGFVSFQGSFSPVDLAANDKTVLYLGADNTLYYPNAAMTVGSCRAVFVLNGLTAADLPQGVRSMILNFGDGETTGIVDAEANSKLSTLNSQLSGWYTLDGRRLSGKPTQRGIYI